MIRLSLKICAFFVLLGSLQFLYGELTRYKDTPSTIRHLDGLLDAETTVLYFGDSTLYRGDPKDTDKSALPDRLQRLLPDERVGGVYHDAYGPDLIRYFMRYLVRRPNGPEVVIVPLNLRAFSQERLKRPEYQFAKEKLFLSYTHRIGAAFFKPLATFKFYDLTPIDRSAFHALPVWSDSKYIGTVGQLEAAHTKLRSGDTLRDIVRMIYTESIPPDHLHLDALREIVDIARRNEMEVVFYLTPLDVARGQEVLGAEFSGAVRENVAAITSAIQDRAPVLDLTFFLDGTYFTSRELPDAYLNERGKAFVAERIAEAVGQLRGGR